MSLVAANSSFASCKLSTADFSKLKTRLGIKDGVQDNDRSISNWVHLQKALLDSNIVEVSDASTATIFFAESFENTGMVQYAASLAPSQDGRVAISASNLVLKKDAGADTKFDSRDGKRIADLIFGIIDNAKSFCEHSND